MGVPRVARWAMALLLVGAASGTDFTGTWKLNVPKSKLGNRDIVEGVVVTRQTAPNTYFSSFDYVTRLGEKRHSESVRVCDGQQHTVPRADQKKTSTVLCTVGTGGVRTVVEKDGDKVIVEMTSTVAPDGKTMTNVWKYEDGEVVYVFDRQ